MAIANGPMPRRTFVTEDPYDGRNEFKVNNNIADLLHSQLSDRDTLTKEKLDMIFGKLGIL